MKFTFRIQYHTVWGEDIRIILQDNETCAIPLSTRDGSNWEGSCNYPPAEDKDTIFYRYGVFRDDVCIRKELGVIPHTIYIGNLYRQCPATPVHYRRLLARPSCRKLPV